MVHYHKLIEHYNKIIIGFLLELLLLVGISISASSQPPANPVVTITVSATLPYPGAPTNFTITQVGPDSINITWTMGFNATTTIIRVSQNGYVVNVTEGYLAYDGNGTSVVINGLNFDTTTYYYRAWSENGYGYSLGYAQAKIGGMGMAMLVFGILPLGFLGLFLWKRLSLLAYGSAATWGLFGFFAFQQSTSPDPAHIQDIYMALFWVCVALIIVMVLLPLVMREKKEKEEIYANDLDRDLEQIQPKKDRPRKEKPSRFAQTGR
jgi:hypothetical protein